MTTVKASLSIELNVNCSECDHDFDLFSDTDLNDEGWLFNNAIPEDDWGRAHENFKCCAICPHCSVELDIKGINW